MSMPLDGMTLVAAMPGPDPDDLRMAVRMLRRFCEEINAKCSDVSAMALPAEQGRRVADWLENVADTVDMSRKGIVQ